MTHNVHGESSSEDEYEATNSGIAFEQRTGKTDFVIALRVSFAYPVYAVVPCAVDDTAVANNERTYRESEKTTPSIKPSFGFGDGLVDSRYLTSEDNFLKRCLIRRVVNRLGLFLSRKKRVNRERLELAWRGREFLARVNHCHLH